MLASSHCTLSQETREGRGPTSERGENLILKTIKWQAAQLVQGCPPNILAPTEWRRLTERAAWRRRRGRSKSLALGYLGGQGMKATPPGSPVTDNDAEKEMMEEGGREPERQASRKRLHVVKSGAERL